MTTHPRATTASSTSPVTRSTVTALAGAVALAAVLAALGTTVVSLVARGPGGVSADFMPLQPATYLGLTVIGVVAAAIGWEIIRRRSSDPARVLAWLVPAVLLVSFVPDILVGMGKSLPHTTWGGVIALMVMHLAVAAAAVPVFRRLLPTG